MLAAGVVAVAPAGAQPGREVLTAGARLRGVVDTVSPRTEVIGRFVRWVDDTAVVLEQRGRVATVRVWPWHLLEASAGQRTHVARNGLVGAGFGALLGAGLGAARVRPVVGGARARRGRGARAAADRVRGG